MTIQSVDATLAKANGMNRPTGVFVQTVNAGSAGEAAGLKDGDIILSVDGKEVNTSNQLQTIVASHYPGESVSLKVYRGGKTIEKKVVLKSRDEAEDEVAAKTSKDESDEPANTASKGTLELESLGMTISNLDAKQKKEYGVEHGVLVENVEPMSESNKRGLAASDVIVSVGDQNNSSVNISSVAQFDKLLKGKKAGDAVLMRVKGKDKAMRFVAIEVPGK